MFSFRNQDLPENREITAALRHIWGVGYRKSILIVTKLGFAFPFFMSNLNNYYFTLLSFLLHLTVLSATRLTRVIFTNIKTLMESGSLRGKRHLLHLPTRGQRTRTNAHTCKKSRKR